MNLTDTLEIQQEAQEWKLSRHHYANLIVNEETRDKLNNFTIFNVQLWADAPEFVECTEKLAMELWGRCLKKRCNHLKVALANLWQTWHADPTRYIAYHRNNSYYPKIPTRYNPAHITKLMVEVIDSLKGADLIEHHHGRYNVEYRMGYMSKYRATPELIQLMKDHGLVAEVVGLHPDGELIQLKAPKESKYRNGKVQRAKGSFVDYQETPETKQMRSFLSSYNAFLNQCDISIPTQPKPSSIKIYRVFNHASWDQGGRFWGGWWNLLSEDDRAIILIDGHSTIELDYACCIPSLMYAWKGLPVPGDVYRVDGYDRKVVKRAFMRCINNRHKGNAIRGLSQDHPDIDAEALINTLVATHPQISDRFFQKIGLTLQGMESDICELILKTLTSEDICCLSIHDSFIVQQRHERRLKKSMVEAFRSVMGISHEPFIK